MVKFLSCLARNSSQTKKFGELISREILKSPKREKAFILGLKGELGGGKTTFLQGFARGLGVKEKILSPTFIIMRKLEISRRNPKFANFFHIDCYRIKKSKEILNLGFKKIISDPKNIIAIEWADKIRRILPKEATILKFYFVNKNKRKIVIKSNYGKIRCRYCW